VKVSVPITFMVFCFGVGGGCGPSHPKLTGPVAATPDAGPAEPPIGAMARAAEVLAGDWGVAGQETPVVFLHPGGGLSAIYGVAATRVPVVWTFDDAPVDAAPDDRHLEMFQYRADLVRDCEEKADAGEGITFSCEDGAGGLHFLANGRQALDVEEWTADDGPDLTHLVEGDGAPAPALEQADLAFEADTQARGADGWVAAYAADAVEWQGTTQIKGLDAIRADITPTLAAGTLTWKPTVSRMLVADALGVTAGTFEFAAKDGSGVGKGTYVTIWRKDGGSWKVVFDSGRPDK
jgi:ketosteroid isomerase-like protein